ncbi:unnamed protein product [Ambrosiozyma monospora]|uniref:Unnamed protein product n=1 Tax=Ambrosiozyma monospora TaxID=43982 RepID=A0ACB5UBE6_AMBMO|nr:unnamed protein product [Ambrosiozyma monospora]
MYGYFLMFWSYFTAFQFLGVATYGEAEFWLALFKVVVFIAFYFFVLVYMCGGIPDRPAFGFHNFNTPWGDNEAIKSIATVLTGVSTAYVGVELLALNAAETKEPQKAIPIAIRQTVIRILFIFIGLSLSYGISVPYDAPEFTESTGALRAPMYIALKNAGWPAGKHLVNSFIVIIAFSSVNSAIYIGTRTIVNMANEDMIPFSKFFARTNSRGVPYVAAITFNLTGFIALMNLGTGASTAFTYLKRMD